jgi:starch phosphorylase
LSVPDGWWSEGHVEGVTGWAIGTGRVRPLEQPVDSAADARSLYDTLERTVIPLFYHRQNEFIGVMRYAIALNGSFFTAQRMLQEYLIKAYDLERTAGEDHSLNHGASLATLAVREASPA